MGLAFADTTKTRRFEDGDAWLELRTHLTKGEQNRLRELASNYRVPTEGDDTSIGLESRFKEHQRQLFEFLAVAWSLAPGKPTADDYEKLDEASGDWVDECLEAVLAERRERAEGNEPPSGTPSGSPTAQRKAAGSKSRTTTS